MKLTKFNRLLIYFLMFFSMVMIGEAYAATYYASNSGSGTICSSVSPCTVKYAVNTKASAGDTVLLKNGTYTGTSSMIVPTKSGTAGNPITIKAENDGAVTIDGQGVNKPCYVYKRSWINIEGIKCTNSDNNAVWVSGSTNINIRRVSGSNAGTGNYMAFQANASNHVLFEDCAAYGNFRKGFLAITGSSYITFRRNWAQYTYNPSPESGSAVGLSAYNSSNSIFENNIVVKSNNAIGAIKGFSNTSNVDGGAPSSGNQYLGNIALANTSLDNFIDYSAVQAQSDTIWTNNVGIGSTKGYENRGVDNVNLNHNTFVSNSSFAFGQTEPTGDTPDDGYAISSRLKNTIFLSSNKGILYESYGPHMGTLINDYNVFYNVTTKYGTNAVPGVHDITDTNPNYNTSTYGNGAYLIRPSNLATSGEGGTYIGAEVLYRYKGGKLTNVPLWPWPMEDRICKETGYSVTYENGCSKGGGIWKTLNGVYSDSVPDLSAAPPNPPTVIE